MHSLIDSFLTSRWSPQVRSMSFSELRQKNIIKSQKHTGWKSIYSIIQCLKNSIYLDQCFLFLKKSSALLLASYILVVNSCLYWMSLYFLGYHNPLCTWVDFFIWRKYKHKFDEYRNFKICDVMMRTNEHERKTCSNNTISLFSSSIKLHINSSNILS